MKMKSTLATTLLVVTFSSQMLYAAGSIEFMCKAKAKEVAAETYQNCVTDSKQAEIERIRKEYQSKLSELKGHYDKELKQLSGGSSSKKSKNIKDSSSSLPTEMAELPAKKLKSNSKVKIEKIDLTASSNTEAGVNADMNDPSPTEIVEIPSESE